ncbi:hypothetical protein [Actibacterium ureilyticum]|uniref:hypothetical protein n=1 Tax=Actibacterium ureilyticum TaxID=1590614 RepID=UPI001140A271|nr:hypothetical protein [Actibacterium ureilyticum]
MTQTRRSKIRIAIPGWRTRPAPPEPEATRKGRIEEFRQAFARDLNPHGHGEERLSVAERRLAESSARLHAALRQN